MKSLISSLALVFILVSASAQEGAKRPVNHPGVHKVVVKEVLEANNYTYLYVEENGKLTWLAVPKMEDAKVGNTYYYQGGMNMGKFTSKDLDKTFDDIVFLSGLVDPDIVEGGNPSKTQSAPKPKNKLEKVEDINIEPAKGGITIARLFEKKKKYEGKKVIIRGKVTRYSEKIMGVNWIHLQDGTGKEQGFDFTATTDEKVNVGDVITIKGKITLDKDFGAGYFYAVIMEEGKIIK